MRPSQIRPFDVLMNTLSGELGLVVEISENKVYLADKTGQRTLYKLGNTFVKVADSNGFKLAALTQMRERRKREAPPRRRARRSKKA